MPRPRWERLDPELRQSILDTATDEFAEHGFERASFNQIIERAGLSKGAVYYYFDDKEDLFTTVMGQVLKVFRGALGGFGPVRTPDEFWLELRNYLMRGAVFKAGNPTFVRLGIAMMRAVQNRRTSLPVRLIYREFLIQLEDIVRQGQEVGAVRKDMPAELLVSMIFAAGDVLQSWFLNNFDMSQFRMDGMDIDRAANYTLGLYRRILMPGDEPPIAEILWRSATVSKEEEQS